MGIQIKFVTDFNYSITKYLLIMEIIKTNVTAFYLVISLAIFLILTGCSSQQLDDDLDCSASSLALTVQAVEQASCGNPDGKINVLASGGEGNYTYSINGATAVTSSEFMNLAAGTYTILVKDGVGCERTIEATVNNTDGVIIGNIDLDDAGCKTNLGSITITAQNGTLPYRFKLGNGVFQNSNVFNSLTAGNYNVTVSDANNCDVSQPVKVLSGVSLSDDIAPIIQANCAVSGCHSGSQSPSLNSNSNIISAADRVKVRTGQKSMPPSSRSPLTAAQIDAIACWVDDNAPNN